MNPIAFFQALAAIIIVQSLLYVGFLVSHKQKRGDSILVAFLLVIVFTLFNLLLRDMFNLPYLFFECVALMAPLIYLYINSVTDESLQWSAKSSVHFIGFFVVLGVHAIVGEWSGTIEKIVVILLFAHSYAYLFLAVLKIRNFHKQLADSSSNYSAYNLKWLNYEVIALSFYFIALGAESLSQQLEGTGIYELVVFGTFLSLLVFVNILTYKSLASPHKFVPQGLHTNESKYGSTGVSVTESKNYYDQLLTLIANEKPFKDSDLHLKDLAQMMSISPSILSQVVNQNANMNFNDFINQFRVEEAKLLLSNKELLVKEVMYECGFNSTSTFNEVFKRHTKMSPSKYRSE